MPISNKYSEIKITNSNVTKLFDTSSFYIVIAVITLKTEKRIKEIIEKARGRIKTTLSLNWQKEKQEIFNERHNDISTNISKEKLEELDKKEKALEEVKKKTRESFKTFDLAIGKFQQQENISEKINNEGIIIEENEYQKYEHVLKEKIEKLIKEKEESYKLIVDDLTQLKEFEYVKQEDLNVEELIEELKSTLEVVKKLQIYI